MMLMLIHTSNQIPGYTCINHGIQTIGQNIDVIFHFILSYVIARKPRDVAIRIPFGNKYVIGT